MVLVQWIVGSPGCLPQVILSGEVPTGLLIFSLVLLHVGVGMEGGTREITAVQVTS